MIPFIKVFVARLPVQKQGPYAFINAWKKLDVDEIISLRTADRVQANGPVQSLGDHEMTNDQLSAMIKPLFAQLSNFKVSFLIDKSLGPSCNSDLRPALTDALGIDRCPHSWHMMLKLENLSFTQKPVLTHPLDPTSMRIYRS